MKESWLNISWEAEIPNRELKALTYSVSHTGWLCVSVSSPLNMSRKHDRKVLYYIFIVFVVFFFFFLIYPKPTVPFFFFINTTYPKLPTLQRVVVFRAKVKENLSYLLSQLEMCHNSYPQSNVLDVITTWVISFSLNGILLTVPD